MILIATSTKRTSINSLFFFFFVAAVVVITTTTTIISISVSAITSSSTVITTKALTDAATSSTNNNDVLGVYSNFENNNNNVTNENNDATIIQNSIDDISNTMKEYYNNNDHSNNDHSNNNNEKQEEEKVTAVSSIGSVGSTRFLHRCRPFVTITYAQSIDGKIALILDNEEEKVICDDDDDEDNNDDHVFQTETSKVKSNPKTKTTSSNFAISGPESLRLTHALRSIHDAILIGGKTLVIDNPRLNNRLWLLSSSSSSSSSNTNETEDTTYGNDTNNIPLLQVQQQQQQPRPVVLDTHLTYIRQLGNSIRAKNLIVCCSEDAYNKAIREGSYKHKTTNTHTSSNSSTTSQNSYDTNNNYGNDNNDDDDYRFISDDTSTRTSRNIHCLSPSVMLLPCKTKTTTKTKRIVLDISDVLLRLKDEFGIQSIMVEGGGFIISEFMNEKLFDYLCVTISPKLLGYHGYGYDLTSSSSSLGRLRCITLGEDSVLFSRVEQTI